MWKILFGISLRNIIRRKLQTILLGTMILITTFTIFAMVGIQTGAYRGLEQSYTSIFYGDFQIRNKDYKTIKDYDVTINTGEIKNIATILDSYSKAKIVYGKRAISFGIVSFNNRTFTTQLIGVEPIKEKDLSIIPSKIITGKYLDAKNQYSMVIGKDFAEYLHVKVGDELVVMTSDIDGAFIIEPFTITGIFKTGDIAIDKMYAFVNLNFFSNSVFYSNEIFTNITIKLDNSYYSNDLMSILNTNHNAKIHVLSWTDILPRVKQTMSFQALISGFYFVIFMFLVAFSVLNSMVLSTIKRIPEFGILSSLGLETRYFKYILLFENIILCGTTIVLASILGIWFVYYFGQVGIPLPESQNKVADGAPLTILFRRIYPDIYSPLLWYGPCIMFVSCLLSILPSIFRLNRSNPVQALTS